MSFMGMAEIADEDFQELDDLFENFLATLDDVWLFGTGAYGRAFQKYLSACGVEITGFVVSEAEAETAYGKPLLSIANFKKSVTLSTKKIGLLITINEDYYDEVRPNLTFLGENLRFIKKLYKQSAVDRCSMQDEFPIFTFPIIDKCNLSCFGCNAGSPIVKKDGIYDFDKYCCDINQIKRLFDSVGAIYLTGGEPLLNPQLIDYIMFARQIFPDCRIGVATNGIDLYKQTNSFWEAASKYGVYIDWTLYPIKYNNYDKIVQKSHEFNVDLRIYGDATNEDKTSWVLPFSTRGKEKSWDFLLCPFHRSCAIIKNGYLYYCGAMRRVNHLEEYFDMILPVCEDDYLNIHSIHNKEQIEDFLAKRPPFCDYCAIRSRKSLGEWRPSKKQRVEWILSERSEIELRETGLGRPQNVRYE